MQQQAQYGGSTAQCGQVVITTATGQQSVDTVMLTIGGKAPTVMTSGQTIPSAIDAATPGDLIIVPPRNAHRMPVIWKAVRLQGVGAASSVINANTHPAGKVDVWRRQINCLFGMALNGQPYTAGNGSNPYDSTSTFSCPGNNWNYFTAQPNRP